jgi:hypothetical protein
MSATCMKNMSVVRRIASPRKVALSYHGNCNDGAAAPLFIEAFRPSGR